MMLNNMSNSPESVQKHIQEQITASGIGREAAIVIMQKQGIEFYKRCGDCGRFVPRKLWIAKTHPTYTHALCHTCASGYEDPHCY